MGVSGVEDDEGGILERAGARSVLRTAVAWRTPRRRCGAR